MKIIVITHWNQSMSKSVEEYVDAYLDFNDAIECAEHFLEEWMNVDLMTLETQTTDTKISGLRFTEVHAITDNEVIGINYVREQGIC